MLQMQMIRYIGTRLIIISAVKSQYGVAALGDSGCQSKYFILLFILPLHFASIFLCRPAFLPSFLVLPAHSHLSDYSFSENLELLACPFNVPSLYVRACAAHELSRLMFTRLDYYRGRRPLISITCEDTSKHYR